MGNGLFYQKFCRLCFRHDTEASTGGDINVQRLIFTEIVAVLSAPLLVLGGKGFLRQATDTFAMPESSYKVHPLFAAIGAGRTGKQAVCIRESGVQQGDQVVFQHGLYFGILLVLAVAGLQHEPGIFFRDISRKCEPVVKTVVGQLHGILLVGLAPS